MRGVYKSLMTVFLEKNWLEGDTVITDFFALYEIQYHDWWIRPKVTYKYNDHTTFALGFNIFAGVRKHHMGSSRTTPMRLLNCADSYFSQTNSRRSSESYFET